MRWDNCSPSQRHCCSLYPYWFNSELNHVHNFTNGAKVYCIMSTLFNDWYSFVLHPFRPSKTGQCTTSCQPFPDWYGSVLHHIHPSPSGLQVHYVMSSLPRLVQQISTSHPPFHRLVWQCITLRQPFPSWYGSEVHHVHLSPCWYRTVLHQAHPGRAVFYMLSILP